jgi:hypothetical protein
MAFVKARQSFWKTKRAWNTCEVLPDKPKVLNKKVFFKANLEKTTKVAV